MSEKELILVNANNEITGYGEKLSVHRAGMLHRAFSVFIIHPDTGELLLQKRAEGKYHSGGKWSNSCCSHPYRGETWADALLRCMTDELHLPASAAAELSELARTDSGSEPVLSASSPIHYAGRFLYYSRYENLSEHEMDHVFLYTPSAALIQEISPDPLEIASLRWISAEDLQNWLTSSPEDFSSWFSPAYRLISSYLRVSGK